MSKYSCQRNRIFGSALISILLFSVVLFAVSSLTFYYVLRNTAIHSTLPRMADPSKPDDQDRANDSTVPAEPETLTSPRPSGPYLDDETRGLFGFDSNAEEQRIEEAEAQRLALVQQVAREAAKRRIETLKNKPDPRPDPKPEDPHSFASINSEKVRGTSEPQPPRGQKVSRVMAGGLFALFLGSITQALQLFGLINTTSGHVFMLIAFVVGILIITTEVLSLKPTKHKVAAIIVLAVLLGAIDAAASLYANKREAGKASSGQPPLAENDVEGNVFLSEEYQAIGKTKTFSFFGDKNYGALSFQARFGMGRNVTIIVLVHLRDDAEPNYAAGTCLAAINNFQVIADELEADIKRGRTEFIDFDVHPTLVCHYDYATDIAPEKIEALKRVASIKHLALSVEGPRGPK